MEAEFSWGGSKSESCSERDGSRCLDIDQSFGDFDIRALSLAAGVSRGVAMGKLEVGGNVGGAATRGVKWVSSGGRGVDGPGIGRDSPWLGLLFVRLRRNLGNTGALVDVNVDEPGVGPLPTPPPSILPLWWGRGRWDGKAITCWKMIHVLDALSQARVLHMCYTFHKKIKHAYISHVTG